MSNNSIYQVPEIKSLMEAARAETDPDKKRELDAALLAAMKVEQMKRGQRTKMTYRDAK